MSHYDKARTHHYFGADDSGFFCSPERPKRKARCASEAEAPPNLSAQEIFKRLSASVMVVESLDASGKVTKFGSGVVIAPGSVITKRHVIEDGVSFRVEHGGKKWPAKLMKVGPDQDLAESSVAGLDAPAVTVLDSSKLAVGHKRSKIRNEESAASKG